MKREPWEFRIRLEGLPPSANTLVRPAMLRGPRPRARLVKTKHAGAWLVGAQLALQAAWRRSRGREAPLAGVPLELRVVFAVSRVSADVSNRVKALEDALTGIAWADDCQVVELFARKVVEPSEHVLGVVRVAAGVDETTQRRISQSKKAGAR